MARIPSLSASVPLRGGILSLETVGAWLTGTPGFEVSWTPEGHVLLAAGLGFETVIFPSTSHDCGAAPKNIKIPQNTETKMAPKRIS